MTMRIKLEEVREVKMAIYNLNVLNHPSREKFYSHTYDDKGRVKSRYLQHV